MQDNKPVERGIRMKQYDTAACRVLSVKETATDTFDFTLSAGEMAEKAQPGQFVHVLVPGKTLRRPISICDSNAEDKTLRLVFQIRGEGTRWLAGVRAGESLDLLGPLGHGFQLGETNRKVIFVGGGIGVPPLLFAARQFGANAEVIAGFRNASAAILQQDFAQSGCRTSLLTDDGSLGEKGFVTARLKTALKEGGVQQVFACGPTVMLKNVAALAKENGVPCQVSLEERMGCGVGACLVCACKTNRADAMGGYSHVCKDGPVFRAEEVEWQ